MKPAAPDEVELIFLQLEAQLDDYERAVGEYAAFMAGLRARSEAVE